MLLPGKNTGEDRPPKHRVTTDSTGFVLGVRRTARRGVGQPHRQACSRSWVWQLRL